MFLHCIEELMCTWLFTFRCSFKRWQATTSTPHKRQSRPPQPPVSSITEESDNHKYVFLPLSHEHWNYAILRFSSLLFYLFKQRCGTPRAWSSNTARRGRNWCVGSVIIMTKASDCFSDVGYELFMFLLSYSFIYLVMSLLYLQHALPQHCWRRVPRVTW